MSDSPTFANLGWLHMKIKYKAPAVSVFFCIVTCALVGALSYIQSRDALNESTIGQLQLILDARSSALLGKVQNAQFSLVSLSENANFTEAISNLVSSYDSSTEEELRLEFMPEGTTPVERALITGEGLSSIYAWAHGTVHGFMKGVYDLTGITDAYIVLSNGQVIYSVTKSDDGFLQAFETFEENALARSAGAAMNSQMGQVSFSQFVEYEAAGSQVSGFWSVPFFPRFASESTPPEGAIVFRLSSESMASFLSADRGTEDVFLMASDGTLLTKRALVADQDLLQPAVDEQTFAQIKQVGAGYVDIPGQDRGDLVAVVAPVTVSGQDCHSDSIKTETGCVGTS